MFYTGYIDANGDRIYEGDHVEFVYDEPRIPEPLEVAWIKSDSFDDEWCLLEVHGTEM